MLGKQLSVQRCLRIIRLVVPRLQRNSVSSFLIFVRCWLHVVSPIMTWLSTRQTTLSVPWLRWLKTPVKTIKSRLSQGIKTWFSWLTKTQSLRFRRKVWPSLKPSHLTTSWRKWGLPQRNSSTSRPSWVISPIIFQELLRLVKRLVLSSSWNTVPLKVSMSILMRWRSPRWRKISSTTRIKPSFLRLWRPLIPSLLLKLA